MHEMRKIMGLMEARKPAKSKEPKVDRAELELRLHRIHQNLAHVTHGVAFSNVWGTAVVKQAQEMVASIHADAARDGETSDVTAKEMAIDLVDQVMAHQLNDGAVRAEIREIAKDYQTRKNTDANDPMDYVEESDFLRFLEAQNKVAATFVSIVPSKPASFIGFVEAMENCLQVYATNSQDEGLIWASTLQADLAKLVPYLIFCTRSV